MSHNECRNNQLVALNITRNNNELNINIEFCIVIGTNPFCGERAGDIIHFKH